MDTKHSECHDSQSEFWLIAHKVRGEPAFDIAVRIKCPICEPIRQGLDPDERGTIHCDECDEGQHWWIVSTSGHRAYPYWITELSNFGYVFKSDGSVPDLIAPMPPDLPDHYQTTAKPGEEKVTDLSSLLGLRKRVMPEVKRRV
jgi:hypothetical protein